MTSGRERSEAAGVELELCGFDKRSRNLDIKTRSHSWNSDATGPVEKGTGKQLPHSLGDDDGQSGRGSTTSYSSFSSQARAFLQTVAGARLPPNSVECMPPPEIQRNLQPINLFHDRNKNEDGNTFQDGQYEVGRDDLTQSGNIHIEGNEKLQHKDDDVCSEDSTKSGNDYGDECSTVSDNPSLKSNETGSTKEADAASLHSDDAGSLCTDETTLSKTFSTYRNPTIETKHPTPPDAVSTSTDPPVYLTNRVPQNAFSTYMDPLFMLTNRLHHTAFILV